MECLSGQGGAQEGLQKTRQVGTRRPDYFAFRLTPGLGGGRTDVRCLVGAFRLNSRRGLISAERGRESEKGGEGGGKDEGEEDMGGRIVN